MKTRVYHEAGPGRKRRQFVLTGEKRPPRRGEWYLSGAIPEAYQAPNDLGTEYHILRAKEGGGQ